MAQLSEMTYFGILINSVLPIIFISFIGFVLGKKGIFSLEEARIINKFVAIIGGPRNRDCNSPERESRQPKS